MVVLFQRKTSTLSDESKRFLDSLPPTFSNQLRKQRQFLPVWSSHKYCLVIKSTFLIYRRAGQTKRTGMSAFWQQNTPRYLNLQHCAMELIDDNSAGYTIGLTLMSSRSTIYFAADTEKDRAKFAAQIAAVQHRKLSLDEFTTHKLLGRGHYGRVVLAHHVVDRQLYAIKEMKLGQVRTKVVFAERAVMEWAGDHPFVMGLEYALARGRSVFLISKFMQGGDLFLHMRNSGGSFHEDAVRFYAAELLLALEHMHKMRILHRDIKPENVLLDSEGHIKLADMGLAKRLASRAERTKTACGTDMYLPPEMAGRHPGGHGLSVDLWQFGCILFELYTGYPPFFLPQSSRKSLRQRILYQPVRFPTDMSSELKSLVTALLEKRQEDRLGYDAGISDIKAHEFFAGLDWDLVYQRQLEPPLVPGPPGKELVANFDVQFTDQPHTIYAPEEIASCFERDFVGFDYVRPLPSSGAMTGSRTAVSSASSSSRASTVKDVRESIECSFGPANHE
uniref:AGC protein kinase n=1 Tax=Peronospora matthiolae TaxID=2874970 RepID=A0AAV1VCH9_9STRA